MIEIQAKLFTAYKLRYVSSVFFVGTQKFAFHENEFSFSRGWLRLFFSHLPADLPFLILGIIINIVEVEETSRNISVPIIWYILVISCM